MTLTSVILLDPVFLLCTVKVLRLVMKLINHLVKLLVALGLLNIASTYILMKIQGHISKVVKHSPSLCVLVNV